MVCESIASSVAAICFAFKLQAFQTGFHAIVYITRQHCFWVHSIGEKGLMELLMKRWCPNFPWKFWIIYIYNYIGRNPKQPPGMYETLQIMGYLPYQLVQDFFHQPYHWLWIKVWLIVQLITCWVLDWAVLLKEAGPRPCWVWNVGWQTPHQDFSGSWGRWTYIWCSSRMLSSPHDITRSTVTPLPFDTKTYKDTPANLPSPARVL